jgi:hypothetical protein
MGEGGFAKSGGPAQQEMVKGLGASSGGIKKDAKSILQFGLSGEISESGRTKGLIHGIAGLGFGIELGGGFGGHGVDLGGNGKV